ncbi:hypothetical protein LMOIWNZ_00077 [Enterococcus phage vB_OCPT_CCS3]|nr:hypothetical protein LMOIWNZ_00077 [Enterococcus phage vB_OCPT_CCS3]
MVSFLCYNRRNDRKGVLNSMLERIKGMLRKITSSNGLATA